MSAPPASSSAPRSARRPARRGGVAIACAVGTLAWAVAGGANPGADVGPLAATPAPGEWSTLGDALDDVASRDAGGTSPESEIAPFVPGELIVRLRPEAGLATDRARAAGFANAMPGDAAASELDEILRRHGAGPMRRIFTAFEDDAGRLIDTAEARLRRSRAAQRQRGARRLPPLPARIPDLENYFLVTLPAAMEPETFERVMLELQSNDWVAAVQPNFRYRLLAEPLPAVPTVPDDPFVSGDGATWSEGSFGNDFPDLFGLRNLHAFEAWSLLDTDANGVFDAGETAPGEGVVVAVIDTGLDALHPEVAGRLFANPGEIPDNGIDDDGNGFADDVSGWDFIGNDPSPEDVNGHGSHVTGTIVAGADNAEGIAGIAPRARVLPLKGFDDRGLGATAVLAAAVHYAADLGVEISSNSWGTYFVDELLRAVFDTAEASGVLSIAAAGNSARSQVASPALFDSVMAVCAVDHADVLAGFSNWGVGVEICAPGVGVLSLSANDHDNLQAGSTARRVGDRYLWLSGTSMATPHVSGVAALLMSLHPAESAAEIRGRLLAAATSIDALNPGREGGLGSGRVDALASAQALPAPFIRPLEIVVAPILDGEPTSVDVSLRNFWAPATGVQATLTSTDSRVSVVVGAHEIGELPLGATADRSFEIQVGSDVEFGEAIDLVLALSADGVAPREQIFPVRRAFFATRGDLLDLPPFPIFVVGATFGDFDADGLQDLGLGAFLARTRLYRQQPDGAFEDVEPEGSGSGRFPLLVDMDGDGLRDLVAVGSIGSGGVVLAVNAGDGRFEVLPESSGFRFPPNATVASITPIDLDADGHLDLVAATRSPFTDDDGTSRNRVALRNHGDRTFSDVWLETEIGNGVGVRQYLTLDWNGDGFQDLLVVEGSAKRVSLYRNRLGRFDDVSEIAFPDDLLTCETLRVGVCDLFSSAAAGDYDNDGDIDLLLALQNNVSSDFGSALRLLENDGEGVYSDVTESAGDLATVQLLNGWWGTTFFDLENDGDLDLLLPIDVVLIGSPVRQPEEKVTVLRNDGGGHFSHVSDVVFPPDTPLASLVTAVGDFDGDGAQDIFAPVSFLPGLVGGLMQNRAGAERHWLAVELDPVASAPGGYGAQVTLEAGGLVHTRQLQQDPVETWRVHFGLGDAAVADVLEVRWPSGIVGIQHDVAVDRVVVLDEAVPCPERPDGRCPVVAIDVDPKSDENPANPKSNKALAVAILGTADFDVNSIDRTRTFFGRGRSGPVHRTRGHVVDVNEDGWPDLLTHHAMEETGIEHGDDEACLRGQLLDRTPFSGCVFITTPASPISQ